MGGELSDVAMVEGVVCMVDELNEVSMIGGLVCVGFEGFIWFQYL